MRKKETNTINPTKVESLNWSSNVNEIIDLSYLPSLERQFSKGTVKCSQFMGCIVNPIDGFVDKAKALEVKLNNELSPNHFLTLEFEHLISNKLIEGNGSKIITKENSIYLIRLCNKLLFKDYLALNLSEKTFLENLLKLCYEAKYYSAEIYFMDLNSKSNTLIHQENICKVA